MRSWRQLTSGCSKPWVAQHVEREWWGNWVLEDQSKKLGPNSWWTSEHRKETNGYIFFGPITAKLAAASQCFYSIERENCAFKIRSIRMRMLELYYKKAKGEERGTSSSRVPTQTSYWHLKDWGNLTLLSGPQHEALSGSIHKCIFSWSCGCPAFARPQLPRFTYTTLFLGFINSFNSTHAWEPGLSRQECSRPLWDTEISKKSSSQQAEPWQDAKATLNIPTWDLRASEERRQMSHVGVWRTSENFDHSTWGRQEKLNMHDSLKGQTHRIII